MVSRMEISDLRSTERFVTAQALPGSYGAASIHVVNLSASGAQIEHAQPIRLGTVARFWFRRGDTAVSVQALTIWSRLSKSTNAQGKLLYTSGLRLEGDANEFAIAMQMLIERGLITPDLQTLDRKRQKSVDRQSEKSNRPTVKMLRMDSDVPPDQALLIQHARERLHTHPEEAKKWFNRARYALTESGAHTAENLPYREDALAVWEYLERSVDLSTIVRVFEKMRQPPS